MINLLRLAKQLRETLMGKPTQKTKRRGNSPYNKYKKQPFFYGEGYKENYLKDGVLHRNGKPYQHKAPVAERKLAEAAE